MELEISYEDDTELAEWEAWNRGYRQDVIVKIGDKKYKVYVICMVRQRQDFEPEADFKPYLTEPNTIIVRDTTKEDIENAIRWQYKMKYFEKLDSKGF